MKKLMLFLLLGFFMISFASAFDFDNVKNNKDITFDGKLVNGSNLLEKYNPIEIKNSFGLGKVLFEGYISKHTDTCGHQCSSTIEINLHEGGALIDNIYTLVRGEDSAWIEKDIRNLDIYIKSNGNEKLVDDYEFKCVDTGKTYLNGSKEKYCSDFKIGQHIEIDYQWNKYTLGEEVPAGIYTIDIRGEKNPNWNVDWVIETTGETLNEWAIWGNTTSEDSDNLDVITSSNNNYNVTLTALHPGIIGNVRLGTSEGTTLTSEVIIWQNSVRLANTTTSAYTFSAIKDVIFNRSDYSQNGEIQPGTFTIQIRQASGPANQGTDNYAAFSGTYFNYSAQELPGRHSGQSAIPIFVYNVTGGTISLDYPNNDSTLSSSDVKFNSTATAGFGGGLVNRTLYIWYNNGSLFGTNTTTGLNNVTGESSNDTLSGLLDGSYLWNKEYCDNESSCAFATSNLTFTIDALSPSVNINSPANTIDYNYVGGNETFNVTFIDSSLDSCWYDYNGTNITIDGCQSGVANIGNFTLEADNLNITFYANDSIGNINSSFSSWDYKILRTGLSFTEDLFEFETNTISVNVTANSSLASTTINFDGSDSLMTTKNLGGGNFNFETDVDVDPLTTGSEEKTFFFKHLYDGSFINSEEINQTINELLFKQCNATFNNTLVNFTAASETTLNETNFSIDATFQYRIGDGSVFKNETINTNTQIRNYEFCSNYDGNLTVNSIINSEASGFDNRTFFFNKEIYNNDSITNTTLLLLEEGLGSSIIVQVRDQGLVPLEGIFTNIYRFYPGLNEYKIVEKGRSDEFGQFIARLIEPGQIKYQFEFLNSDNVLLKKTDDISIACTTVICVVPFVIEDTTNDFENFENITSFDATLNFNNVTNIFMYSWTDLTGDSITSRLLVEKIDFNQTNVICNVSSTSTSSSLNCDVSSFGDGKYRAQSFRKVSGENERRISLLDIVIGDPADIFGLEGLFLGFMLTFTLVAVGSFNPTVGIILYLGGFVGLGSLGIISMSSPVFFAQIIIGVLFIWAIRS